MKDAIAIITHAVRMLFFNPATTVRVLMPALVCIILSTVLLLIWLPGFSQQILMDPMAISALPASDILTILGTTLLTLLGYLLMAVLWHRHVLLPDHEVLRPGAGIVASYLWRAILVGLVQVGVFLVIGFGVGLILGVIGMPNGTFFMTVAFQILGLWLGLRISVILPAAALGEKMSIGESWELTKDVSGTIWGLAVLLAVINVIVPLISTPLINVTTSLSTVVSTVLTTFVGLIFISVLTTLYGHLVEKRPLG